MVCGQCGRSVKSDFKFCPYCGERIISDYQEHYGELMPPFLIDPAPEGPDEAAALYAPLPGEELPDFGPEPEEAAGGAPPEPPAQRPYAFPEEDGLPLREQPFRIHLPEELPEEPPEEAPYFVYHAGGGTRKITEPDDLEPPPTAERRRETESAGPGPGVKLLVIFGVLIAAAGLAVAGYQFFCARTPFQIPPLAAALAAVYTA